MHLTRDQRYESLLVEIARCPIAIACLNGEANSPCSEIVLSQATRDITQFQSPEPWSGQLDLAPLLFISSNPSIAPTAYEQYPRATWDQQAIVEYFDKRFGGSLYSSVQDGIYDALPGTTRSARGTRYWISIRARAAELLGKSPAELHPGLDYALTEIVRCKSTGEKGVAQAVSTCTGRYLASTFELANATTFVVVGAHASKEIAKLLDLNPVTKLQGPTFIAGKQRMLLFLPHPASFETAKTVNRVLTPDQLGTLRSWIDSSLS